MAHPCVSLTVLLPLLTAEIQKRGQFLQSTQASSNVQTHNIYFFLLSKHDELHFSPFLPAEVTIFLLLPLMLQLPINISMVEEALVIMPFDEYRYNNQVQAVNILTFCSWSDEEEFDFCCFEFFFRSRFDTSHFFFTSALI